MNQGIFFRINGIRVIDVFVTIISAVLISRVFKWSLYLTIPGMFLLGIVAHRIFGIHTTVDKYLFD
jgi:hypothetical protein